MSTIRPTTDHRTLWLLAACILALCLTALAPGASRRDRAAGQVATTGSHICTPEILLPKPPPPDQDTTEQTA